MGPYQLCTKESHSCLFWEKKIRIFRSFSSNLKLQQSLKSSLGVLMGRICQFKSSYEPDCNSLLHHIHLLQKQNALFLAFAPTHSASGSKSEDELLLNRTLCSAGIYSINCSNKILGNRTLTLMKSVPKFPRVRISLK